MSNSNILSVEDLIKNKVKLAKSDDKEITATLSIPSLGGKIRLSYTKEDCINFFDTINDIDPKLEKKAREEQIEAAGLNLVYTIVAEPNLKTKALQDAYECKEPLEIVKKVFHDGEINDIMEFANEKAGFRQGTVVEVEDLKN